MKNQEAQRAGTVLLFLSDLKASAVSQKYDCPNGDKVEGLQTNEAPVQYLLNSHDDIDRIICLTTPQAKESAEKHFRDTIEKRDKPIEICSVEIDDAALLNEADEGDFGEQHNNIIKAIPENSDLYLDTTGGFRNAVIYLLLITRIMVYRGCELKEAVYSDFHSQKVMNVTSLFRMLDLVSGMEEMTTYGSVNAMRRYYEAKNAPEIKRLLDKTEELNNSITLNRSLDEKLQEFGEAMADAEETDDALFCTLLPSFQKKFGIGDLESGIAESRPAIPDIIRWCLQSGRIQQAATLYNERIPAYLKDVGLFGYDRKSITLPVADYQDESAVFFSSGFLNLGKENPLLADFKRYYESTKSERLCNKEIIDRAPAELRPAIANLLYLGDIQYPHDDQYSIDWKLELSQEKAFLKNYSFPPNSTQPKTRIKFLNAAVNNMNPENFSLLTGKPALKANRAECFFDELEELTKNSPYLIFCTFDDMRTIAKDYLYIKMIRNMFNHANGERAVVEPDLCAYLESSGYKKVDTNLSVEDVRKAIESGLAHIMLAKKRRRLSEPDRRTSAF